jgi:hypothetical protein
MYLRGVMFLFCGFLRGFGGKKTSLWALNRFGLNHYARQACFVLGTIKCKPPPLIIRVQLCHAPAFLYPGNDFSRWRIRPDWTIDKGNGQKRAFWLQAGQMYLRAVINAASGLCCWIFLPLTSIRSRYFRSFAKFPRTRRIIPVIAHFQYR